MTFGYGLILHEVGVRLQTVLLKNSSNFHSDGPGWAEITRMMIKKKKASRYGNIAIIQ